MKEMRLSHSTIFKMVIVTALFLGGLGLLEAQTPEWQWAVMAGGTDACRGQGITVDSYGYKYVTGFIRGTASFGETELQSAGREDIFVAKFDAEGNWIWAERAGGENWCSGNSIAVDSDGNIYLTGVFYGTASFLETELQSAGGGDIFVAKLDNEGNWLWAKRAGGNNVCRGRSIAVDGNGNSYVTGGFSGTATFGEIELQSAGGRETFVAKTDYNGNWLWAEKAGGTIEGYGHCVDVDIEGNSYITGRFRRTATFGETELQSEGDNDIFVAKMDNNGNWIWAKRAGGNDSCRGMSIAVDGNGNNYITGGFSGTATFGEIELQNEGPSDLFVAKMDAEGNWIWAERAGGTGLDIGYSITTDNYRNSFITGFFERTANFGDIVLDSDGRRDIFVAKVDSIGNWLWAKKAGGPSSCFSESIAVDSYGICYVTGYFEENITFGEFQLNSLGRLDAFVAKIGIYPYPVNPANPCPVDDTINVSVDLDRLLWEYTSNPFYEDPAGFRVYFNDTGEFDEDDDFGWVPYIEGQERYSASAILPDHLEQGTRYYWNAISTTREEGVGEGEDARDCPTWTFQTIYPEITLDYPNGGELWLSGTTRTIRWSEDACPEVNIYISFDNGTNWNVIAENPGTAGYFHYQVPELETNQCLVKVSSLFYEEDYAVSENVFRISTSNTLPKVSLSYPSEEDIYLEVGEEVDIQWTRQNVGEVALDFSVDDGVNWNEIARGIEADRYQWEVPDSTSLNCRIRVRCAEDAEVLDISDDFFSISKVELLAPLGGETITSDYSENYSFPVRWSAPGVENVRIEYSLDEGDSWKLIADSKSADEELYNWRMPGNPTRQGLLKVANANNTNINAVSDSTFVIRNPIRLTNANGGGFITDNSLFNIRWQMQDVDTLQTLFWEYSDNDRDWTRINEEAVSVIDESMFWFANIGVRDSLWLRCMVSDTGSIIGKSESSLRVTEKALVLERPDGGEEFRGGTVEDIRWDYDGLTSLDICYTYNDGESWHSIVEDIPANHLSYNWDVPNTPSELCRVRLQDRTLSYMVLVSDKKFSILQGEVSVNQEHCDEPVLETMLVSAYPNPFNPYTNIEFSICKDTQAELVIYNIRGQLVKTLHSGVIKAGVHSLIWNGKDNNGREVGSGVFFYRLKTDHYDQVNKMLLVK